jgi:hypothetical protein
MVSYPIVIGACFLSFMIGMGLVFSLWRLELYQGHAHFNNLVDALDDVENRLDRIISMETPSAAAAARRMAAVARGEL